MTFGSPHSNCSHYIQYGYSYKVRVSILVGRQTKLQPVFSSTLLFYICPCLGMTLDILSAGIERSRRVVERREQRCECSYDGSLGNNGQWTALCMSNPALNHLLARTRIVLCKNKRLCIIEVYIIYFSVVGRDVTSYVLPPVPSRAD
jgi:hypothetical protein